MKADEAALVDLYFGAFIRIPGYLSASREAARRQEAFATFRERDYLGEARAWGIRLGIVWK